MVKAGAATVGGGRNAKITVKSEQVAADLQWLLDRPPIEGDAMWDRVVAAWSSAPPIEVPAIETAPFVGPYFEHLCNQLLLGLKPHRLIRSLRFRDPAIDKGRGESELDFLLRLDDGWHHLEVAAKFYLGIETQLGIEWVGPNQRDRLAKKRRHMHERQSQRLNNQEARDRVVELLAERDIHPHGFDQVRSHCLIHGVLFQPHDRVLPTPSGCSVPSGRWLSGSKSSSFSRKGASSVCDKPFWFQPHRDAHPFGDVDSLDRPIMVSLETAMRAERVFVVPDDWASRLAAQE